MNLHPTAQAQANAAVNATTTHTATPSHPALDLLARYRAVWASAWVQRHELVGPRRLADEVAFLPAGLSLQETPPHPAPRRLAWVLMALLALAMLWACLGQVDIVAVASGRIVVSERTKVIQPLERSVINRILVNDGQTVTEGQPLVELDATSANADRSSLLQQAKAQLNDILRTTVLLHWLQHMPSQTGTTAPQLPSLAHARTQLDTWTQADHALAQIQLDTEWRDALARLQRFDAEKQRRIAEITTAQAMLSKLETTLPLARQREADIAQLSQQGFMAGHAGQDRTRERIELERDLATQQARLAEAQATLRESEHARIAWLAETRLAQSERRVQAELKLAQARQELAKAQRRETLTTLRAPVAGTVQQLAVHTAGGVATEAQALMVIVPQSADITAEVMLDNKDIGFVQASQPAEIKFETFPFTRYGTVEASVQHLAQDAVTDPKTGVAQFPATLVLAQSRLNIDGKAVHISPGMNVTAEIKTGQRRVIDFLLSPIVKAGRESLRER